MICDYQTIPIGIIRQFILNGIEYQAQICNCFKASSMKSGRHRLFDKEVALDVAMELFWTNGYSGTSLSDLTESMGITKPSLYWAFGNKEKLYKSVLERYVHKYSEIHQTHLMSTEPLKKRVKYYLGSIVDMVSSPELPGGCFVCMSSSESVGHNIPDEARTTLENLNTLVQSSLIDFFTDEIEKGHLSKDKSAASIGNYILSLQMGLAVMARNGIKRDELKDIVELSIENLFNE